MAVLTVIELGAGTIQGAVSYAEYCEDDDDEPYNYYHYYFYYYYHYRYAYDGSTGRCDFYNKGSEHNPDVDFLAVVIVAGIGTFFWVSSYM